MADQRVSTLHTSFVIEALTSRHCEHLLVRHGDQVLFQRNYGQVSILPCLQAHLTDVLEQLGAAMHVELRELGHLGVQII